MLALLALACAPEEAPDVPLLLGTIEARDSSAEVWDTTTYFYAEDSTMFLFMSASEAASCEETGAYLSGELNGEDSAGPAEFAAPGTCTLTANASDWDGSLEVDLAEGDATVEVSLSVNCWMDGDWVIGDEGWTFDGKYWNGTPTAFHFEVEGEEADGTYAIEMSSYEGRDPYDFSGPEYPGEGLVEGTSNAVWCEDLEDTPIFD